ncbi:MAG: hypothetical protein ACP5HM_14135 [Anaerolineae bacterium]
MKAKQRAMLVGALLGAAVGMLAGLLYYNTNPVEVDEEGNEHLAPPSAGDALKLGLSVLGILRSLSA